LGKDERAQMSEKSGNQHLANGLTSLVFGKLQEFDRSRKLNPEAFFNDMLHVIRKRIQHHQYRCGTTKLAT
jgi:hypothetical protein